MKSKAFSTDNELFSGYPSLSKSNFNNKIDSNVRLGMLVFFINAMHMLRNLSQIYFVLWAISFSLSIYLILKKIGEFENRILMFFIVNSLFLLCIILSYNYSGEFGSPLIGIARIGFILPVIYILLFNLDKHNYQIYVYLWLIYGVLAALSLPIQYLIGPVAWFSESFERVGTQRFGSLAGSLTTFGNISGALLFIAFYLNRKILLMIFVVIILLIGIIASLQKAAIASVLVSVLTLMMAGKIRIYAIFTITFIIIIFSIYGIYFIDFETKNTLFLLFETFTGTADAHFVSDVSIYQSLIDRVTYLPMLAFDYYGYHAAIIGVGVFGGSGSLGYPELPHTHNLFGETIMIFGILPAIFIFIFMILILRKSLIILIFSTHYETSVVLAAGIFINMLIPTIFAGALFYHPAGAGIFWASVIYLQFYGVQIKINRIK